MLLLNHQYEWPEGTDSITSTLLEVEYISEFSIFSNPRFYIELIDYPSEWILDIAMLNLSFDKVVFVATKADLVAAIEHYHY